MHFIDPCHQGADITSTKGHTMQQLIDLRRDYIHAETSLAMALMHVKSAQAGSLPETVTVELESLELNLGRMIAVIGRQRAGLMREMQEAQ